MEILMKAGIYQTIKPHIAFEKHGGSDIKHEVYWNLCFYPDSRIVGFFGGEKGYTKPYITKTFDTKGEIVKEEEDYLELYLLNPFLKIRKFYKGKIEGDRLYLKYHLEGKPKDVFEDVFGYIGTGERTD